MKAQIKATTYRYKEGSLLKELKEYIDSTYSQHYATGNIQATEDTIDDGHGIGYCIGNCKKYLKRYGKKGTPEDARKDLLKNLHYGLIALYVHDLEHSQRERDQQLRRVPFSAPEYMTSDIDLKKMEHELLSNWDYVKEAIEQSEQDQGKNNS